MAWIVLGLMVLSIVVWMRGEQRSIEHIHGWAERHGYEVAGIRRRWLWAGRFWWRKSDAQRVYDVVFVDGNGRHRSAQVRVGGWFLGSLSDEVRVEWIDP